MSLFQINRKLLPIKIHYFIEFGDKNKKYFITFIIYLIEFKYYYMPIYLLKLGVNVFS